MRSLKIKDKIVYVGDSMPRYRGKKGVIVDIFPGGRCPYHVLFENGEIIWCHRESLKTEKVESSYPNLF